MSTCETRRAYCQSEDALRTLHHPPMDQAGQGSVLERATEAAKFLSNALPEALQKPQIAIVCGSGLGGLQNTIESRPRCEFQYADIPHFPASSGE